MFPDKLHVSSFPDGFPHYAWKRHSEPTPTSLGQVCTRVFFLIFFFTFYFLQLCCPNRISPMGNSGCLPQGKPAATESRYPTYGACWVFQCCHDPPNSYMGYGIFNVHTYLNACDYTRGCIVTVKKKSLAAPGNQTCVGDMPVRCSTN